MIYTTLDDDQEMLLLKKILERYPNHPSLYKYKGCVDLNTDYYIERMLCAEKHLSKLEFDLYEGSLMLFDVKILGFDKDFIDECVELKIFSFF